jgi:chromosome partitioning protein
MQPKINIIDSSDFMNITVMGVMKQLKTKKIILQKTRTTKYLTHNEAIKLFNFKVKPTAIAFELVKGGVGKTSLSFHCAVRASLYGLKCAMIDLDQQANLTRAFRINAINHNVMIDIIKGELNVKDYLIRAIDGIDLLPSSFDNAMLNTYLLMNAFPLDSVFKKQIDLLKKDYDLIFIDCPPDLGATVTAAAMASDILVAPIEPDEFSLSGLSLTLKQINRLNQKYNKNTLVKIVLNKFNGKTNLSHKTLAMLLSDVKTKELLFNSFIRLSQDFPNTFDKGISIFDSLKQSVAKEDIDLLTKELLEMIKIS